MHLIQEHRKNYVQINLKKGEFSMKKLSVLILLVIVASLLVAAIPTKMLKLTIINKSGSDVYMKLEGSSLTDAYYYLTIPSGDRDEPVVKVFTVMSDVYSRTTWQCNGLESSGGLVMDGNTRLTFSPCYEAACKFKVTTEGLKNNCDRYIAETKTKANWAAWVEDNGGDPENPTPAEEALLAEMLEDAVERTNVGWKWHNQGEPRMEKVTYWKGLLFGTNPKGNISADGYWNFGCVQWWWSIGTAKLPVGCDFRYQY